MNKQDDNALKILHVFPSPFPGGSEKSALETIISLSAVEGIQQYAIFPGNHLFVESVKPYVTTLHTFTYSWWLSHEPWPFSLKIKMIRGFYKATTEIAAFIKTNGISLVITHSIVVPVGALGAARAGCEHIWYLHEYGDIDHQLHFNYGKSFSLKVINRLSRKIIVNSLALESYFARFFPVNKIKRVYYAVSMPDDLLPTLQKPANCLQICMLGRIAPGKNQMIALQALYILKQENIFPSITFVGNGNEKYLALLHQYAAEKGLQNQLFFAGQQSDPVRYIEATHCVLVCSLDEAFGRVTIEGMKAGKVPVISNTGAGPELVVDGETGFLFSPHNSQQLANIFKELWYMTDIGAITTGAQEKAFSLCNMQKHREDILNVISG